MNIMRGLESARCQILRRIFKARAENKVNIVLLSLAAW